MAPELQAKLLRVLEDGEVRAVGADVSRKVDVREGRFRQDLFYRLSEPAAGPAGWHLLRAIQMLWGICR